jgi:hypothetical protein
VWEALCYIPSTTKKQEKKKKNGGGKKNLESYIKRRMSWSFQSKAAKKGQIWKGLLRTSQLEGSAFWLTKWTFLRGRIEAFSLASQFLFIFSAGWEERHSKTCKRNKSICL